MKKIVLIGLVAVAVLISSFYIFKVAGSADSNEIIVQVEQGKFIIDITTTGELEAKNSVKIMASSKLRSFRVYQVSIQDIVDEGTVVEKGEWIATLDQSDFNSKLQDKEIDLEKNSRNIFRTNLILLCK